MAAGSLYGPLTKLRFCANSCPSFCSADFLNVPGTMIVSHDTMLYEFPKKNANLKTENQNKTVKKSNGSPAGMKMKVIPRNVFIVL